MYNAAGDVVAVRNTTDNAWTCTTYDNRGRITSVTTPAFGTDTTPRTVTTAYAVNNDARTSTLTDATGTLTSTVDLLDRAVAYTDTHGVVTTTSYDQAGRVTGMVTQGAPGGGGTSSLGYTYRDDGQPATVTVDGPVMATATYDTHGELAGVTYPFGTLDNLSKTPAGALIGTRWTVGTRTFTEELTRSYLPTLGIFTSTDPIQDGNDTPYTYPNDPINQMDTDGNAGNPILNFIKDHWVDIALTAAMLIPGVGAIATGVRIWRMLTTILRGARAISSAARIESHSGVVSRAAVALAGRRFVGRGANRVIEKGVGHALRSKDGLRQYRSPVIKGYGRYAANFETRHAHAAQLSWNNKNYATNWARDYHVNLAPGQRYAK